MKYIEQVSELKNACVAFGRFEGVHKGHQKVLETVASEAKKRGLLPVVISVAQEGKVMTTEQEKSYFFEQAGIEAMVTIRLESEELTAGKLLAETEVKAVVAGAQEDLGILKNKNGEVIECISCEMVKEGNEVITSALVRDYFEQSKFETVTKLCGHPYIMMGEVVHGKALGRTVGMPTANLGVPDNKLKPPSGVYATLGHVIGSTYKSLTNIGTRPSVDDMSYITIEVFLLDFAQSIYGEKMTVEVHQHIRGVQKFANLEEVQLQVKKDLEKVRSFLDQLREKKPSAGQVEEEDPRIVCAG